jgi:biotin transport system substrate-specific component
MNSATTLVHTLAGRTESVSFGRAFSLASVLFVATLTAAAAQVSVPLPFTSVPFTFQPMIVLLGGLALGSKLGAASQVVYLAAGIAGLPVFAASGTLPPGPLRLLGPTGGYLMAYPVAAFVVGYLAERGLSRRYMTSVVALLAGLAIVYACGATWLALFARVGSERVAIGVPAALLTGVAPFVLADLVKLFAAAGIVPGLWRLMGRS